MEWLTNKWQELFSNFWIKSAALIPASMIAIELREKVMLITFAVIITIDCIFGAMVAIYCDNNFDFSVLGKKFSKKFLLYFFTLFASFLLSNAYDFMEWWFYTIGTIILFSEFGSLMAKAEKLGLPIKNEYINAINKKIDAGIRLFLNIQCDVVPPNKEEDQK